MNTKTEVPKTNGAAKAADTAKGASETKVLTIAPPNPLADKLKKINDYHLLCERRKKLIDTLDDLQDFEKAMNGETDEIELTAGNEDVTIKRPAAVKKCLDVIKAETTAALQETENQIFNANL